MAVVFFAATPIIRIPPNLSEPGPRVFPYMAEAMVFVCSILMFFQKEKDGGKAAEPFLTKDGWKRLGIVLAMMGGYALLLFLLGFIVSTVVSVLAFIYVLQSGAKVSLVAATVIAAVATSAIYLLFNNVFSIRLPEGLFFTLFS